MALSFISESAKDFQETATIGGFGSGVKNNFDDIFTEAYNTMLNNGIDLMVDVNSVIKNKAKLNAVKEALIGELKTECTEMENTDTDYGTHAHLYDQVSQLFDNCVDDFMKESTKVPQLLPIKAIDFPILVKQQLKLATKDIIQTEVTKSPIIKKHIEQTYIVDNNDKTRRWKYPQCFFTDEFKEIFAAGKGLPIKDTPVELPAIDFDVVANLTDADAPGSKTNSSREEFTMDLKITKFVVEDPDDDTKTIAVPLARPMRINLSDNMWLGGKINTTVTGSNGTTEEIDDIVTGVVDFVTKKTSVNSLKGVVKAVVFSGYLSNEKNERHVTFDYGREEIEWKIEDGTRVNVPYSLEELEDAKALMDIDLYKKTYNNLADYMTQMEDSTILAWLDEQFDLYDGVEISQDDILGWGSFITKRVFDCDSTSLTTALPNEYIEKMLKFKIDRLITDICDKAKIEDMTFVIYGNPRFISLLNPVVNWITRPGSTANGVKLDYGYGIMTSGDVKVQVVSTKKVTATYDEDKKEFSGIRLIPYPLSNEQFTFKHYKYTTHILTAQNSAYRAPDLPGGSMTNLMGVSRYTNAAVQGIQAQLKFANAEEYIEL
jgi:hypothetical protein